MGPPTVDSERGAKTKHTLGLNAILQAGRANLSTNQRPPVVQQTILAWGEPPSGWSLLHKHPSKQPLPRANARTALSQRFCTAAVSDMRARYTVNLVTVAVTTQYQLAVRSQPVSQ